MAALDERERKLKEREHRCVVVIPSCPQVLIITTSWWQVLRCRKQRVRRGSREFSEWTNCDKLQTIHQFDHANHDS
jgi:hypothetical protein